MSEIDVSKCVHYHDGGCGNDNTMFECCSKNNCIYKQLQQLKAENIQLNNVNDLLDVLLIGTQKEAGKYKAILDEIEERLKAVSYLEPQTTRILKMDIENIIKQAKEDEL